MLGRRELELRKKRAVSEHGGRNLSWKHRRPEGAAELRY